MFGKETLTWGHFPAPGETIVGVRKGEGERGTHPFPSQVQDNISPWLSIIVMALGGDCYGYSRSNWVIPFNLS